MDLFPRPSFPCRPFKRASRFNGIPPWPPIDELLTRQLETPLFNFNFQLKQQSDSIKFDLQAAALRNMFYDEEDDDVSVYFPEFEPLTVPVLLDRVWPLYVVSRGQDWIFLHITRNFFRQFVTDSGVTAKYTQTWMLQMDLYCRPMEIALLRWLKGL